MNKSRPMLDGFRILVVEDAPDLLALLEYVLEDRGASINLASNGQEALDLVKEQSFDFILMDLQMPVLDGYTCVSRLRGSGYTSKIFALTAHAVPGERERCLDLGFDEFLVKPIDYEALVKRLSTYPRAWEQVP